ncbi:hypothetical protein NP233_g654 [Leucocoprinus birnbaumii]|uniref:Uncharacterized protein n=1 Tax=Leucocoprinus birnbaumii TaxID=56174 RepID=A0AAD5W3H4_9AGAR|nr:hypothetical protein NP233_g654 [Leucocoprinus birnbaumii]
MPLPRKSYKDTKAVLAKSNATSPVTTPVDENGKAQPTASPTLPPPKSNLGKDARAYEHERQRLKKAADFVKMRARKAQGAGWAGNKPHQRTASTGSAAPSEKGRRLAEEDEMDDEVEGLVLSDSWKENMGVVPLVAEVEPPSRYEVRLADLIQAGKLRKPKGDGDFEVVPHIRSVIVLDDNTPDEFDVDEPWEHVLNPDSEANKGPSYAQVAALAK